MRLSRQSFLILLLTLTSHAIPGGGQPGKRGSSHSTGHPDIVLITLDTTRADRMGFLGSKRGLTPNLDTLARESTLFTHAYAQAPLTSPSHATILTGTYPQFHGVLDFPMPLANDLPYGPQIFHEHGYATAAFVASVALDPKVGAPGFDRGFDKYDADFRVESRGRQHFHKKDRYNFLERPGNEVVARALAWLDQGRQKPFFLWVHLYDAHGPYEPPEPYRSRYSSQPYDGEIAYDDAAVGRLLHQLKTQKLYDGAVIAVMADHGESLWAHGEQTHGVFLYDETIHVPLVIKLPHSEASGKHIQNQVELADVLPTLLQVARIATPLEVQGESLMPLIQGEERAWQDRPAYARADYAHLAFGWSALESWRTGKYLFVDAPRRELYDDIADSGAERNLAASAPAVVDTLADEMHSFRQRTSSRRERANVALDPETQRKLAALGYVAMDGYSSKSSDRGADPKDRIDELRTIQDLNEAVEDGRFEQAVPMLQDLIGKEPNMAMLYIKLAECYMKTERYEAAVPVLRKAVELQPWNAASEMNLGVTLLRTRRFDEAATALENVVARVPNHMNAHSLLEVAYYGSNRFPEAIEECKKVMTASPDDYRSTIVLGLSLARTSEYQAALQTLQRAIALRPDQAEPHAFLASVYTRLGRGADAERELAEAKRLGITSSRLPIVESDTIPVDQH
jgi:arylsulfatase A-like enzyme/Flp pilus assembly protein TadD